jgi:hypothetical protein
MLEKFLKQFFRWCYIFGLGLMIVSLPHSKFMMSVSQFWLASVFAVDRIDIRKMQGFLARQPIVKAMLLFLPYFFYQLFSSIIKGFRMFFANKPALIFSSIFLLHLAGLFFTSDYEYALKDLRTKLPLFLLPLFISTATGFRKKDFYWFILLFTASVLVRTFINSENLFNENFVDIRNISKSISHIIVALLITLSVFCLGYFIFHKRSFTTGLRILFSIVSVWLLVYLVLAKSVTGIAVSSIALLILLIILIIRSKTTWIKISLLGFFLIFILTSVLYFFHVRKEYYHVNAVDFSKLDSLTSRGTRYTHYPKHRETENGNYIWIYLQWDELRATWNQRSKFRYDSLDLRHQRISNTLVRFLASKGYRKDADGVNKLTEEEIREIEKGVANVVFTKTFSIRGRIYELLWGYDEFRKSGDPTGSSVMQRLEFWKASAGLIKENWLTGVGTGDMNIAFSKQYNKMHTKLAPEQRWRSHDQFLSIFVGFGIFGLLWFLLVIFYPPAILGKFRDYFFLIFIIISIISMIPEDTIESQAGVTFFAFFYSFLMFGRKENDPVG